MSHFVSQLTHQAEVTLNYLSSEELRELLNDDEKLEAKVNELVGLFFCFDGVCIIWSVLCDSVFCCCYYHFASFGVCLLISMSDIPADSIRK